MKKLLTVLLLLCMLTAALTACGNETTNPAGDNTNTETTAPENEKKEFTPEIIPAEKVDPRQAVIDYMYKMANLEWTPSEDIDFTQGENKITDNLYYKKGVKYHGIMYVTGNRTMTDYDEFSAQLNEKGEYIGPVARVNAWGNHCSSAVRLAYDLVQKDLKFGSTPGMVPSKKMGTLIVGDYKYEDTFTTTDEIIDLNGAQVLFEAYTHLQPGDCILTCWGPTGHARMIIELNVEKSASGKINAGRSHVICIEQTSSFDKQAKDGKNTTWYVEHVYTFNELFEAKYVPLTISALNNTEKKDNEFTTRSLNTAENITEGKLKGLVRSSYLQILSATVEVLDEQDNVVCTETYKNTNSDRQVFQFSNRKAPDAMTSLSAGNYKYVVTANTLYGSAKVAIVEFTVE